MCFGTISKQQLDWGLFGDFFSEVSKHATMHASVFTADGGILSFLKSWVIIVSLALLRYDWQRKLYMFRLYNRIFKAWGVNLHIHCKAIITLKLINTSINSHIYPLLWWEDLRSTLLINLSIQCSIVTMLYLDPRYLFILLPEICILWLTSPHPHHLPESLATTVLLSGSMSLSVLEPTYKWDHIAGEWAS